MVERGVDDWERVQVAAQVAGSLDVVAASVTALLSRDHQRAAAEAALACIQYARKIVADEFQLDRATNLHMLPALGQVSEQAMAEALSAGLPGAVVLKDGELVWRHADGSLRPYHRTGE